MTISAATTASAQDTGARRLGHIAGLDGLRGVAVVLVLLYHLEISGFGGGFLGVDIFFVLSGFLITSLLLGEEHERGSIGLVGFWLRRARRLLPALFVMLAVVLALAPTIDATLRGRLRWDSITSALYVVNWRYVLTGQSYAAESEDPSMLGHLWSLAIEEQFYILWPLVVLGGALILRRRHTKHARLLAFAAIAAACTASAVALALTYDRFDPSQAYFSTYTRLFEPLAGALLAVVVAPRQYESVRRARPVGGSAAHGVDLAFVAGSAALVWSLANLSFSTPRYYQGGAVVATAAAAVLIAAVVLGSRLGLLVLGGSLFGVMGRVSYGLYLWHWPVIVWLDNDRTGWSGAPLLAARLVVIAAATALSYRFVEEPIRSGRIRGLVLSPRVVFPTAFTAVAGLVVLSLVATIGAQPIPDYLRENDETVQADATTRSDGRVVALIGDSVSKSLGRGLVDLVTESGDGYVQATYPGCAVSTLLRVEGDGTPFENAQRCIDHTTDAYPRIVRESNPDVVIWYSQRDRYGVEVDGEFLRAGTPEWREAVFADWDAILAELTSRGAEVALVLPFYSVDVDTRGCEGPDPEALMEIPGCIDFLASLTDGVLRAFYRQWAAGHPDQVAVVDLTPQICGEAPQCAETFGGVALRPDDNIHFSPEGADEFAPVLLDAVDQALSR